MNWLKRIIINWAHRQMNDSKLTALTESNGPVDPSDFTLNIMNAMNGKVIHIRSYQPQRHGPDWKSEYYIVPEGESLSDAVTVLLMAKNLEKA